MKATQEQLEYLEKHRTKKEGLLIYYDTIKACLIASRMEGGHQSAYENDFQTIIYTMGMPLFSFSKVDKSR